MARRAQPWFRFYVETFGDRKIRRIPLSQRWVWAAILGAARESPEPGSLYIAPGIPMTIRELAEYADAPVSTVEKALAAMQQLGMVSVADGVISALNWNKRQFESDNVTERVREHRERSKEHGRNVSRNVGRNTPETETETETETEKEQGGKPPAARKRAHQRDIVAAGIPAHADVAEGTSTGGGAPDRDRPTRATQLPDNFAPNDTNRSIAAERGVDLRAAFEQFVDYHRAKGSTFKDWHLAFNTWLRRERPSIVANGSTTRLAHVSDIEQPPDGLTDAQYAAWAHDQAAKRRAAGLS